MKEYDFEMEDELTLCDVLDTETDEEELPCCGGVGQCLRGCGEVDSPLDFFSR